MKILIIKETSLGDVLHSTIAIEIIKKNYPEAEITFLVDKSAYDIVKHNPNINDFIVFDFELMRTKWKSDISSVLKLIKNTTKKVRKNKYDMAFDLQGLLRSVYFLYRARADKKFVKGRWICLKHFRSKKMHAIEEIKNVLRLSGMGISNTKPYIYTTDKDKTKIYELLKRINPQAKKILLISPFTGWISKNWGINNYKRLTHKISNDILVLFTGVAEVRDKINNIIAYLKNDNAYNLAGELNLLEFVELIKNVDLVLTSDGFPMHTAGAFNIPVISLFGPSDENRVGPISDVSVVLRAEDSSCSKCYKRNCRNNLCMKLITPETVYEKIRLFLNL